MAEASPADGGGVPAKGEGNDKTQQAAVLALLALKGQLRGKGKGKVRYCRYGKDK